MGDLNFIAGLFCVQKREVLILESELGFELLLLLNMADISCLVCGAAVEWKVLSALLMCS